MLTDSHWRAQLTVRGWLFVVLLSMGLLVLAGAVAGGVLLHRTDDVARSLSEQIQPARRAAFQLQASLRDQETGVRGYVIAADRQFLTPYYDGQHAEHAAAEEIRRLLGQRMDLVNDLDAIERAAAIWRASSAEPLIANVTPNSPGVANARVADRAKAEFDHLRGLFDTQNADFAAASAQATDELRDITAWRDWVLGAVVLVFFGLAVTLGLLTRAAITLPLAALAASCRRITEGSFTESISPPPRPKDIRDMAIDVENMRQRIVSALDNSRAAEARLDEQAIELKRSNAELEQFAYVASHDLQEPLRKVASFCQLLEKRYGDQLDERGIEYINYAVDGAKRMQVLINDLLSFSRVGRVGAKQTEVDLDATLDAAVANLGVAIEESNTEIVRPGQPLPRIVGDPTLLTMLWQNLIGNAIKFRHIDRSPRVVIDCELRPDTHQWLLTVSDNGIGIAEEFTEKVFVIFQRLHGREVYPGTGVGLALVKKIVEYHDGTVAIDTTYVDGTRFEFTLPVPADAERSTALEGARQ
ncbi:sensor histidine kinase [Mycobacterium montefiorense]|uniref:sensor histidine kinase n=1 Tax=Mycobacterium montefiorense TaxID=154654 RepID=UPI0021DC685C|nr:sensor histidine kinase [Mycobacterium montefiorense]MCV7426620.1 CHASE3 domain-containing protein [Mycobacterium montefiorense]GLE52690.1 histidine kinase [Mycobacterium montefiorense]